MKKYLAVVALLLLISSGRAQNPNLDYKYGIKLYNLTTFADYSRSESDSNLNYWHYMNKSGQVLHPTFAFQWKTGNNNFHEIELTDFMLGFSGADKENDSSDATLILSTSLRYEYILNFGKSKDCRLVPSLGFAASPYYFQFNTSPENTSSFKTSEKYFGAKAFITPRLTYYFSPKFFLDLNVPLCIFDASFKYYKIDDPSLPIGDRTTNSFNFDAFPKFFSIRLGVGVKF